MKKKNNIFRRLAAMAAAAALAAAMIAPSAQSTFAADPIAASAVSRPMALDKVVGVRALETTPTTVKLAWTPVANAQGYAVFLKQSGGYKAIGLTTTNRFDATGFIPSCRRHFIVRAYYINPDRTILWGPISDQFYTATSPETVRMQSYATTYNTISLAWTHTACTQYIIYQVKNGSWTRIAKQVPEKLIVRNLEPNTTYRFVIRACKLDDYGREHLGGLSNVLTVTTPRNTIVKKNGLTYVNDILIANKTYSLPSTYNPGGLTSDTYNAFLEMQSAAARDGISLWICSGFRSYSYQGTLYNNYVWRDGKAAADTYSARPGHSEHQTGLAMDINNASSSFEGTPAARWLAANCWKYGFIIRYPKGKQSITGFIYEPWHVRYLGKTLAKKVTASGLCLEEYLGITSQYNY